MPISKRRKLSPSKLARKKRREALRLVEQPDELDQLRAELAAPPSAASQPGFWARVWSLILVIFGRRARGLREEGSCVGNWLRVGNEQLGAAHQCDACGFTVMGQPIAHQPLPDEFRGLSTNPDFLAELAAR